MLRLILHRTANFLAALGFFSFLIMTSAIAGVITG